MNRNTQREKLLDQTGTMRAELNRRIRDGEPATELAARYRGLCPQIQAIDKAAQAAGAKE